MSPEPSSPPSPPEGAVPVAGAPPEQIRELTAACLRFVFAALRFELDFSRDTLPVLDHYLEQSRASVHERPETLPLVASACGAYLGEVIRRLHACWWRTEDADPLDWRLEFRDVYLTFRPGRVIEAALTRPLRAPAPRADDVSDEPVDEGDDEGPLGGEGEPEALRAAALGAAIGEALGSAAPTELEDGALEPGLVIDAEARAAVRDRLDRLPPVPEDEYWAPSTRLEVVDIVVDALRNAELGSTEPRAALGPEDYDD